MWADLVSNPGPLTYESGSLPTTLRGPATCNFIVVKIYLSIFTFDVWDKLWALIWPVPEVSLLIFSDTFVSAEIEFETEL